MVTVYRIGRCQICQAGFGGMSYLVLSRLVLGVQWVLWNILGIMGDHLRGREAHPRIPPAECLGSIRVYPPTCVFA